MTRLVKRAYNQRDMEAIDFFKKHMNEFCDFADTYMLDWYKDLLDDNEDEWIRDEYGKPKSDEEIFKLLEDKMENNYLIGGYFFCALDFFNEKGIEFHQSSLGNEHLYKNIGPFMNRMRESVIPKLIEYIHARFEGF